MLLTNKMRLSIRQIVEPIKRLLLRQTAMSREKITAAQALEWCQNYLCGAWSTITAEQMRMERISGGLSNYLYSCSLPDDVEAQSDEPRKILLRVYGEAHRQHRSTLLIDSVVCALLSERKIGPRVHGVFPEGRLEEFVEADSLLALELRDKTISHKLGRLLGEIHQLEMPLAKEPVWLFRTIDRYMSGFPADPNRIESEQDRQIFQELCSVCNFTNEFENLKKLLATVDSPVCFSHNDFQPGNILRMRSDPDNYTVIDFEYCSYNYRGFDIGNHFCEFIFDYKSATEWPLFKVDFRLYPDEAIQMTFIRSYIDALVHNDNKMLRGAHATGLDRDELARQVMREANYFALASHFMWAVWAIYMAVSTTIKFGYMEHARARMTAYFLHRDLLLGANGDHKACMPPQITDELLRSSKNPFRQSYAKAD